MNLLERLNQPIFNGSDFTIYKIARDFIAKYSLDAGFVPDNILIYFDKWIQVL